MYLKQLPVIILLILLPKQIRATEIEVDKILQAICHVESGGDSLAYSYEDGGKNNHSFGECQVTYRTAQLVGMPPHTGCLRDFRMRISRNMGACTLFSVELNRKYAKVYLQDQLVRYKNNIRKAVSAYNAGKYIKSNVKYVNKVMRELDKLNKIK